MKTRLSKWGNSLALRIPKPIAEAAMLREGDILDLDVEGPGAVRIHKPKLRPTLEALVNRITDENRHAQTEWGEAIGNEVW